MAACPPLSLPLLILSFLLCSTAASASRAAFIHISCGATRYPNLCERCLMGYAPSLRRSSPRQLAHLALTVSADRARSASAFVGRMAAAPGPGPKPVRSREVGAVRDCVETMRDSVDRLRSSIREMGRMGRARSPRFQWALSNVQTWVSGALTDETTCLDGLSRGVSPAVRSAIRGKVVEVAQVTSNALALVNRIGQRY
ncbi:pectinesterase inhibitor 9-like [Typha angustifolia]|uniref:pectinesterase inhibitor 9-like n=1 Tax=Typha angustifolia TaxID=59011 RepID=UPI003C2CBB41